MSTSSAPGPHPRRIVVATEDTLGDRLAGAAIRAWEIASALAADHEVWLVTTSSCDRPSARFRVSAGGPALLSEAMGWCDVFIAQGWVLAREPSLVRSDKVVVVDLYDPMHLEQLEQGREAGTSYGRARAVADAAAVLNQQVLRGDLFLVASERQRQFWLGHLAALGRVNPLTYDASADLSALVATVPFGLSAQPPQVDGAGARGTIEGIGTHDKLLVWGGGIYNWFDPLTLIDAVGIAAGTVTDLRLLFLGTQHPNPNIPAMAMVGQAHDRASAAGLLGSHVFFREGWVPFDQRQNFLCEADVGVSHHHDHIETTFAFRTRILDYLWAGLPIVCTAGDSFADLVEQEDLGLVVPAGDRSALAEALIQATTDGPAIERWRSNVVDVAQRFTWPTVLEPLVRFCADPRRAPDLVDPVQRRFIGARTGLPPTEGLRGLWSRSQDVVAQHGGAELARRGLQKLRTRAVPGRPPSSR